MKFVVGFILIVATMFAVACGGPDSGEVFEKKYEKAWSYVAFYPVAAGQTCYGTGTTQSCTTNYIQVPYTVYDDADWVLHIRDEKGDEGWAYVDETTYHSIKIGDWYGEKPEQKIVDTDNNNSKVECNDC